MIYDSKCLVLCRELWRIGRMVMGVRFRDGEAETAAKDHRESGYTCVKWEFAYFERIGIAPAKR